jgi:hypothetical protein
MASEKTPVTMYRLRFSFDRVKPRRVRCFDV